MDPSVPKLEYASPATNGRWEPDIGWPLFVIGITGGSFFVLVTLIVVIALL